MEPFKELTFHSVSFSLITIKNNYFHHFSFICSPVEQLNHVSVLLTKKKKKVFAFSRRATQSKWQKIKVERAWARKTFRIANLSLSFISHSLDLLLAPLRDVHFYEEFHSNLLFSSLFNFIWKTFSTLFFSADIVIVVVAFRVGWL